MMNIVRDDGVGKKKEKVNKENEKTEIGLLDKTGKVLYASAEVVLGGLATVGAVIYTASTGGVGGVAGGAYVGTHGVNSVANGF